MPFFHSTKQKKAVYAAFFYLRKTFCLREKLQECFKKHDTVARNIDNHTKIKYKFRLLPQGNGRGGVVVLIPIKDVFNKVRSVAVHRLPVEV